MPRTGKCTSDFPEEVLDQVAGPAVWWRRRRRTSSPANSRRPCRADAPRGLTTISAIRQVGPSRRTRPISATATSEKTRDRW